MLKLENFKNNEVAKALETLAVTFNYKAILSNRDRKWFIIIFIFTLSILVSIKQ